MSQCFRLKLSLGTVAKLRLEFAQILVQPTVLVHEFVKAQPVVYADETTWVENFQSAYVWVAAKKVATALSVRLERGAEHAKALLGISFEGIAVTDRYAGYHWLKLRRQSCWAHLVRDFARIANRGGRSMVLGREMKCIGEDVLRRWRRWKSGKIQRATRAAYVRRLRTQIKALANEGLGARHVHTEGTCLHLLGQWPKLWTLLANEDVDPTNDAAERSLRHAVIWRTVRHGT